jgi:cytochrome c biogenesis protein CcmG/thiol:disulfide interchange protein DsbE
MRVSFRHWVPLGLFVVVAVVLWQGLRHDPHQLPSTMLAKKFPALAQHPDWQGKVVVLNVFASWCLSCQIEHPLLMDMVGQSPALWVGLDYMDTPESAQAFLQANGSPYRQVINDPDGKLAIDLGVYGVPETFVLDKRGVIRYRHAGPLTHKLWQTEMQPLIQRLERA